MDLIIEKADLLIKKQDLLIEVVVSLCIYG